MDNIYTLNGTIMSGDTAVVKVKNGIAEVVNCDLAPLYFKNNISVEKWLKERAIDSHRTNSRLLKKALRLEEKDDISTVLYFNAVTITDNYWFQREGENLKWEDVKFCKNDFAELALRGDPDSFNKNPSRTPELTNIGSFEKCWKLENNKWWIYKKENENEMFSELFISKLGIKLGLNMAHYELDNGYIKTLNFTDENTNFEPFSAILDNDDYQENFDILVNIDKNIAKDYLKMIYLDSVCFNMDRHTKNYGLLRDNKTGEIKGLAPNFDNNVALISNGYPKNISREDDGLIGFLFRFLESNVDAVKMIKGIGIPEITKEMIDECINEIPIDVDKERIEEFILNGQKQINIFLDKYL